MFTCITISNWEFLPVINNFKQLLMTSIYWYIETIQGIHILKLYRSIFYYGCDMTSMIGFTTYILQYIYIYTYIYIYIYIYIVSIILISNFIN